MGDQFGQIAGRLSRLEDNINRLMAQQTDFATSGAAFPTDNLFTGRKFFRTDRGIDYYYDGTRWLSTFNKTMSLTAFSAFMNALAATATASMRCAILDTTYGVYVESLVLSYFVSTTFTAVNHWTINLNRTTAAGGLGTPLSGTDLFTTGDLPNTVIGRGFAINTAFLVTDAVRWFMDINKVNAPGTIEIEGAWLSYRLIG